MFSEGKSPVEVAILLDLAADRVRAIYQDYWELTGRHELAQLYDEARYDLRVSLRGTNPGSKMIALLSLQI
jgi:hypothetical protein